MAGTTALLKSAASVRDQMATYQDSVMAFEYSNSAYTDSALSTYEAYLKSRIAPLNASGSIGDASKALSLTKALDSATKSNVTATIQRENINMMAGGASLTDKYNVIVGQYSRAVANGDLTLAQSLMSQAYSVDQSIQLQGQQAQDAAVTLARAAETAGKAAAASEGDIASSLTESLKQLNNDIKSTGMGDMNKTVKAWTEANAKTLESLGVKLPNQPNYWDIVTGVAGAQYNHHMLAAQMYAPYGTGIGSQSWTQAEAAYNINSGISTLHTLAGDKTLQEVMQAATNNNQYIFNPSTGKMVQTQQVGNQQTFDKSNPGQGPTVAGQYSGTIAKTVVLSPKQTTEMQKLGLNFSSSKGQAGDGVQVQATDKTPVWLQQVLGKNGATNMYTTTTYDATGKSVDSLQFTYDGSQGQGKSVYTVLSDNQGHLGLFEQGQTSEGYLHGEYGFNPSGLSTGSSAHPMGGHVGSSLITPSTSASSLLGAATGNYAPPIPLAQPAPLPNISLPAAPVMQSIQVNQPSTPATSAVVPHTVSVQKAAPVGQSSNQSQNINNAPGNGIVIKGTVNGPVGGIRL